MAQKLSRPSNSERVDIGMRAGFALLTGLL